MAGHSKWANIQHRKGAQDKKRGKLFTKLIREITVAARMGGGDLNANPRLRLAVDKAMKQSMPKDNVERAIKRGSGDLDGDDYEEIRYEGYGPNGVAIMVECMTDNRNRTVSDVRHAFSKHGGNLGSDGSVSYLFTRLGLCSFAAGADEDAVLEAALEAGADDVEVNDDQSIDVTCDADDFATVSSALADAGFDSVFSEIVQQPSTSVDLDAAGSESLMKLVDALDDLDDVQEVHHNGELAAG